MKKSKQQVPLYDLKLPAASINNAVKTLKSGWLSTGENVRKFELAMAGLLGVPGTVATNSATAGLVAALRQMGVEEHVITTPFTFVATVEAICLTGGYPALVDIDSRTLNLDPERVRKRINHKTRAILAVDFAGHPCEYDKLSEVAREAGIPLIIDASHSLGATHNNKSMAQIGDAAIYSFHATKNLVCGEGGLVATQNKFTAEAVKRFCQHGITSIAADRKSKGATSYDITQLGFKGTMSELHAAVGLGHFNQFEANQKARTRLAERYLKKLNPFSGYLSLPALSPKAVPAWHLFVIQLDLERWTIDRDRFIREMTALGVECGVHFKPIFDFSFYKRFRPGRDSLPVAAKAGQQVVTLPLYPTLKPVDVDYVSACIGELIDRFGR